MNRRDEMRQRISAIRKAYLEGRDPPITTTALQVLRQATGADVARLYYLAEDVAFEVYWSGVSEHDAALVVADEWRSYQRVAIETTGAPHIPLAESGGYMRIEKAAEDMRRLLRERCVRISSGPSLIDNGA